MRELQETSYDFDLIDRMGRYVNDRTVSRQLGAKYPILLGAFGGDVFRAEMEADPSELAPYPVQSRLTGRIRTAARVQGREDVLNYWAGQSTPLLRHHDAATCFGR